MPDSLFVEAEVIQEDRHNAFWHHSQPKNEIDRIRMQQTDLTNNFISLISNNNSNLNNKKSKIPISITTRDESDDDSSNSEASANVQKDSPTLSRSSSNTSLQSQSNTKNSDDNSASSSQSKSSSIKTSNNQLLSNELILNNALSVTNNYNKPTYVSNKKIQIIGEERIRVAEDIVNNFDGSAKFYVYHKLNLQHIDIASEEVYRKILQEYYAKDNISKNWIINMQSTAASFTAAQFESNLKGSLKFIDF
jgi:hypothetical protein